MADTENLEARVCAELSVTEAEGAQSPTEPSHGVPPRVRTPETGEYEAVQVSRFVVAVGNERWNCGGYVYDLIFDGEMVVRGSKAPIYDLCRALRARGLTGRAWAVDEAGMRRMSCDIEKGAKLTVVEDDETGLRIQEWKPFDEAARSRVRTAKETA